MVFNSTDESQQTGERPDYILLESGATLEVCLKALKAVKMDPDVFYSITCLRTGDSDKEHFEELVGTNSNI